MNDFKKALNLLGWQGGTIHQIKAEYEKFKKVVYNTKFNNPLFLKQCGQLDILKNAIDSFDKKEVSELDKHCLDNLYSY